MAAGIRRRQAPARHARENAVFHIALAMAALPAFSGRAIRVLGLSMRVDVLVVDNVFDLGLSAVLDVFETANELIEATALTVPRFASHGSRTSRRSASSALCISCRQVTRASMKWPRGWATRTVLRCGLCCGGD